uniref:Uncharacterized protein n=1 Tax=viral metagenome TaxID=1070528 RepID=A0A6H1ZT88_9ZZZZ
MRSDNITISVILAQEEIDKVDELAGKGNRSAYLRCLIQHATGGIELKLLDVEAENRHLYSLLKEERALTRKLKERLAKKGQKIVQEIDKELVSASLEYHTWREGMLTQLGTISRELKLAWVTTQAKQYGITTVELLKILEPPVKAKDHGKKKKKIGVEDPLSLYNLLKTRETQKQSVLDLK